MNSREIIKGVSWVGVMDPGLKVFDVIMNTEWGTTYNSYVVKGKDKVAVIEMVKGGFDDDQLETIKEIVDPKDIDYIILNHTEPDHSGSLAEFLDQAKNATVVSSRPAYIYLKDIVNGDFPHIIAKDGDTIDLGGRTLRFISAPFLHWPDSMFTYLVEENILFSGDVFGCHYCPKDAGHMFNDEVDMDIVPAQRYYFDVIMSPFKAHMLDAINKIRDMSIDIVCPSHGPILRDNPWDTINMVEGWSKDILDKNDPKKIFIGYVSAYGNTKRIGEAIAEGIKAEGDFDIEMLDISQNDISEIIPKIDRSDAILLGSPTINRDALEPVWRLMSYINAFKNKGKLSAAFGSYGWSGEAVGMIEGRLKSLGLKVISPGYRVKLVPNAEELNGAKDFGRNFAHMCMAANA